MLRLGWFSTGRGEGSQSLLRLVSDEILRGSLDATIEFVFCNREPGEAEGSDRFHSLVGSYDIPLVTLSSERFRREKGGKRFGEVREAFDSAVIQRIRGYEPEVIVLAGYMLFTAAELCQRYTLLNAHPAPPDGPVGTWQQVIWQLIRQGATHGGVQVQRATMDWDRGPLVSYCTFPLTGQEFAPLWDQVAGRSIDEVKAEHWEQLPLFQRIRSEELKREAPLLLETLRELAEGSIGIAGDHILDAQGNRIPARCLNDRIERLLHA